MFSNFSSLELDFVGR